MLEPGEVNTRFAEHAPYAWGYLPRHVYAAYVGMFYSLTRLSYIFGALHSCGPVEDSRLSFVSPRPPTYAIVRVCPPSLECSLSLTSCFITLRGRTTQRESPRSSGRAQIPPPRPGTSVRHTITQSPCTSRPDNGPSSRPVFPNPREPVTLGAHARHTHVATSFTLGPPRTSEGFLPLPHA